MQVEQVVGSLDDRPHRACALQLCRVARAVERRRRPQPVEILVDIARGDRVARIEFLERRDIVEAERQLAAARPDTGAEQAVDRDRAADLVAVGEPHHRDMWPGLARGKGGDVFDPGITGAIGRNIGRRQLDREAEIGHGRTRGSASSPNGNPVDEPLQEDLAARHLLQRDELVGLVRLVDRAGADNHRRYAGGREQPALGAEGDLDGAIARQAQAASCVTSVIGRGVERSAASVAARTRCLS